MSDWKSYIKTPKQLMRDYVPGEDLTGISVAPGETPKEGGKIAKDNQGSRWYISPEFITGNYIVSDGYYGPMECHAFVNHIRDHLSPREPVVCKICDKSIHQIISGG